MAGRFSVNNLFKGIRQAIDNSLKFLEQQIWNRVKPYLLPVLKILSIVTQILTVFKQEIKQIARFIQRLPGEIIKQTGKIINPLAKQIQRLPKDFQDRLFKFSRNIDSTFRKVLSPFQKAVTKEVQKASNNIVKFGRTIDKASKDVGKVASDVKNLPKKVATEASKEIGKQLPGIVKNGRTALLEFVETAIKSNPKLKASIEVLKLADEVIKPLSKNTSGLAKILKTAPSLMDDVARVLGPFAKGGKVAFKALPIVGEFVQALDWEYFKGEFRRLFRQVNDLDAQVDALYQQMIKSRISDKADKERIINIERLLLKMNGVSTPGGNPTGSSSLSQLDINRITSAVKSVIPASGTASPQAIAQAVSATLAPQLSKPVAIDYQQVRNAVAQGMSGNLDKATFASGNAAVLQAINGLKPLFPSSATLARDISKNVSQSVTQSQQNNFTGITNQLTSVTQLLNTINNSNSNISNTVNKISNTTVNNGITLSQLQGTEQRLTNEVRKAASTPIDVSQLATQRSVQTLSQQIASLNINPRVTVNPTPVTVNPTPVNVTVPQTLINQINSINPTVRNTIQQEIARIPKQQADPKVAETLEKTKDVYQLLGGDQLKNGLTWNPETMIKGIGEQVYQGSQPLVNNVPMAMALVAAPLFMRGGLHKFPASVPSDLNNPNAAPTVVNHAVGLQQAYHGLIDQRLGAPSPIKVTGADGQTTVSRSRSINESLDTVTGQLIQNDTELEILQQTVTKLAAETMAIAQMVLVDHDILESLRDFCGYRYTEQKRVKPTEISLGKESLLDWFTQSQLHYVGTKFDGKMDLTEMLQKLFLEIGKVSNSHFARFDPADPNQKIVGQNFSKPKGEDDDEDWKQFIKFVKETPVTVKNPTDPTPKIERYTNNDTATIDVSGVTLPQG